MAAPKDLAAVPALASHRPARRSLRPHDSRRRLRGTTLLVVGVIAVGVLAATAPGASVALPALFLAQLRLGRNLGLVSGTAIIKHPL